MNDPVIVPDASVLLEKIFDIMEATDATFYDAAYHSVALKYRGTYVSADDKYVRKAVSIGYVIALKDWK
jgi:predicted nucleic acid-binding protein